MNVLFENVAIRQNIVKPYLLRCGADPLGQRKLPSYDDLKPIDDLRERMLGYIPGDYPKATKDAKYTLIWPKLAEAFSEAKWIIVRRDKDKIVDSCLRERTSEGFGRFMSASDDPAYWRHWVEEHERRFCDMMKALPSVIQVWTDGIVKDPTSFAAVAAFCGLDFDHAKVEACINRKLWH